MIQPNAEWDNYWRAARIQRHEVDPTGTEEIAPFFLAEASFAGRGLVGSRSGLWVGALSSILIQSNYSQSKFLGVDLSYDGAKMAVNKPTGWLSRAISQNQLPPSQLTGCKSVCTGICPRNCVGRGRSDS